MRPVCLLIVLATVVSWTAGQYLVLLGGNLKDTNTNVWNQMVTLAGGKGKAKIGVISASRSETPEGTKVVNNFLNTYGALSAVQIPVSFVSANLPATAAKIEEQTGIFIVEDSGVTQSVTIFDRVNAFFNNKTASTSAPDGVVCYEGANQNRLRLISALRPLGIDTLVMTAIRKVLNNGGMVAGNSAIMGSTPMVLKGDSLAALTQGTRYFYWPRAARVALTFNPTGGLGLLHNYVLDSQTSELGREGRLLRLAQIAKSLPVVGGVYKGLGVDRNTAFVVTNPSSTTPVGKVITDANGTSGVLYVDVSGVSASSARSGVYNNVPLTFITVNDTMDLSTNQVTYASFKVSLTGRESLNETITTNDIFSTYQESQWRDVTRTLINAQPKEVTAFSLSTYSVANIPVILPRAKITFDRSLSTAYGANLPGTTIYVPSFVNMLASIKLYGPFSNP